MSDDIAIKVQNLSKVYKLYDSPADRLKEAMTPFRKQYHSTFHALEEIDLEVRRGETVGIIGRNGSGKSTLLKLITGVLTPTSGTVLVKGKISALLELSAGFNPEMTGLENVYFNCTLNGYTRQQIDEKLDQILSFADIGEFINQKVRLYSSGMAARLGFAVAIHVDPEILIVDEALSVGDMAFQNKCFRKIDNFVNDGKTVLFVSHALPSVRLFCDNCLWLHQGRVRDFGATEPVTDAYERFINAGSNSGERALRLPTLDFKGFYKDKGERVKDTHAWLEDIKVLNSTGEESSSFVTGETVKLQIGVANGYDAPIYVSMGVAFLSSNDGMEICRINNIRDDKSIELACGYNLIELTIPSLPLLTGEFFLSFFLAKSNIAELFHKVENMVKIGVTTPFARCGWRRFDGIVAINHNWRSLPLK